ncbi:SDR family NAD(P)-dependent oxidoreductase [Congregibacter sp.]|jgi:meso-butanediol dehydrogenase/(S,S)-butanediol dehydrogenase/diacetyl reductase|uniref:SDR family NAD(P)-dependent oxidoreductase n=1 Tax=Congregibacter sp. TaxID=2744308 RepID=UPI0039E534A8
MNAEDSQVLDFRGRVALVTGAASGMGAATAKELAARGAHVVVVDQNGELAAKLATEINGMSAVVGDVSDASFCQGAVASAVARHGRLDILVNCAGIIVRADASDTSDDDWRRIIDVNVGGVFFMSRAAVAIMQIQKRGAIVNFGSIWGDVGAAGVVAYCASKGAVHQLTRAMALDHVGDGIRINAVAPGEVNTPMLAFGRAAAPSAAELQKLADETIPMRRLADPIEIARVVAFLASDSASYMTGTIVTVDAGYTAR